MRSALILAAVSAVAIAGAGVLSSAATAAASPELERFAACAVKQYEGAELLATLPGSEEEADVLAAFASRGCGAPSETPQLVRGAVAEALFKADFGAIGARPKRNEIQVFSVDMGRFADMDMEGKRRVMLVALGTCVADAAAEGATSLLRTAAGSANESQAITQIQPGLSQCLAQGQELTLAKSEVRAGIAEGAYRSAVTRAISQDIIVTGTRDPGAVVTCRNQTAPGTRFRRQVCLTEAQWKIHQRDQEIAMREMQRRAEEWREMQDLCVLKARGGGGISLGNPEFAAGCL